MLVLMREESGSAYKVLQKMEVDLEQLEIMLLSSLNQIEFPETDLRLPKNSLVPTISEVLEREAALKELFEVGMEAERKAEIFYKDLADKTRDSNSKRILEYLASMEHSHYSILEAEYHQLELGEDLNTDDYLRGERLMNLGP